MIPTKQAPTKSSKKPATKDLKNGNNNKAIDNYYCDIIQIHNKWIEEKEISDNKRDRNKKFEEHELYYHNMNKATIETLKEIINRYNYSEE